MVPLLPNLKRVWHMIHQWQEDILHPKSKSGRSSEQTAGAGRAPPASALTPDARLSPAVAAAAPAPAGGGKSRCPAPVAARLRVEKIEGGLVVAGFVVAANCQIVLPIFGFLFMLVGCVLTAASYRGPGADELPVHYAARIAFTGNSRVLGPICIVTGAIMTIAGVVLCLLTRVAQRKQRRLAFHCPLHGDFYPVSPIAAAKGGKSGICSWWRRSSNVSAANGIMQCSSPPRCPRSRQPSARTEPTMAAMQDSGVLATCPAPLPFLVPSDSVAGMGSVLGAPLSPEQTFGSIRSLTVSREVASFPLSRTPSPPPGSNNVDGKHGNSPLHFKDDSSSLQSRPNFECGSPTCEFHAVECRMTTTDKLRNSISGTARVKNLDSFYDPRHETRSISSRSVSIIIPEEGKG